MTTNEQQVQEIMGLVDDYALASYQQGTLVGVGNRPDKVEASIKRTAERRAAVESAARPLTAATSAPEPVGEREAILAYLVELKDDAAAHIWPDDLGRCQTSECVVQVASVRMGSPDGRTVPLFTIDQVAEAIDAARASKGTP